MNKGKFDELAKSLKETFAGAVTDGGDIVLNFGSRTSARAGQQEHRERSRPAGARRPADAEGRGRAAPAAAPGFPAAAIERAQALEVKQDESLPPGPRTRSTRQCAALGLTEQGRDGNQRARPRDPPDHGRRPLRHRVGQRQARGRAPAQRRRTRRRPDQEPHARRGPHGCRAVPRRRPRQRRPVGRPRAGGTPRDGLQRPGLRDAPRPGAVGLRVGAPAGPQRPRRLRAPQSPGGGRRAAPGVRFQQAERAAEGPLGVEFRPAFGSPTSRSRTDSFGEPPGLPMQHSDMESLPAPVRKFGPSWRSRPSWSSATSATAR